MAPEGQNVRCDWRHCAPRFSANERRWRRQFGFFFCLKIDSKLISVPSANSSPAFIFIHFLLIKIPISSNYSFGMPKMPFSSFNKILQFLSIFSIFAAIFPEPIRPPPFPLHPNPTSFKCLEHLQNNSAFPPNLPSNKPPFDPVLARRLFHLAAGAYANSNPGVHVPAERVIQRQEECIQQSGLPAGEKWTHQGVHAEECAGGSCSFFVVKSTLKKQMIIAFRGTNTHLQLFWQMYTGLHRGRKFPNQRKLFKSRGMADAINLDRKIDSKNWGRIHKYFAHAFNQIWPDVRLRIEHFKKYNLIFTGHSLGGALASLAAAQTRVEGFRSAEQITLYTFGQPRIGNYEFAMAHSAQVPNSYRIVNREDGVVHMGPCLKLAPTEQFRNCFSTAFKFNLPPESKICVPNDDKFYHQGMEIWYSEGMEGEGKKEPKLCGGIPLNEDVNCSAGVPFSANKMPQYIFDHQNYYGQWVSQFGMNGCKKGETDSGKIKIKILEEQMMNEMHIREELGKIGKFMEWEEQKQNERPILDEKKEKEEEKKENVEEEDSDLDFPGESGNVEESESKSQERVKFPAILRDEQNKEEKWNRPKWIRWLRKLLGHLSKE